MVHNFSVHSTTIKCICSLFDEWYSRQNYKYIFLNMLHFYSFSLLLSMKILMIKGINLVFQCFFQYCIIQVLIRCQMEQYSILGRIGEGAHGIVLKAKHIEVVIIYA